MQTTTIGTHTKWTIDPAHSEVGFRVKHLVFSNVRGTFKEFDASIQTLGDDFMNAEINVRVNPASVDTANEQRNVHLRSADFFDADQFSEIRFTASGFATANLKGQHILEGELTMKGISKLIKLEVEFGGIIKDPWGAVKALFTIDGKINRKDWGLNYNAALETGGVLISEEVWIHCEVQLIKQPSI